MVDVMWLKMYMEAPIFSLVRLEPTSSPQFPSTFFFLLSTASVRSPCFLFYFTLSFFLFLFCLARRTASYITRHSPKD